MPTPEELSHGMLIALLMDLGGSYDLPATAFESDAMGTADGTFHAVELRTLEDGTLRLQVVARPPGDQGGVEIR